MALKTAVDKANKFKAALQKQDLQLCEDLLVEAKSAMLLLPALPPMFAPSPTAQQELALARDVLEHAVILSVLIKDDEAFERNLAQLRPYYADLAQQLPPSQHEFPLLGLNLLRLLVQNRVAEFHTELELLPADSLQNMYIKHSIELEQSLMEGAYSKVLAASANTPMDYYKPYMDQLVATVRDEVASCSEQAYEQLKIGDAAKLLMLGSEKDALDFARSREWAVSSDNKTILFSGAKDAEGPKIPAMTLISHSLAYAKELERIV